MSAICMHNFLSVSELDQTSKHTICYNPCKKYDLQGEIQIKFDLHGGIQMMKVKSSVNLNECFHI